MIQMINIKTPTNSTLYYKGVVSGVCVAESLSTKSKKDERNIAKYLVVPNNLRYFFRLSSLKNLTQHKACLRLYFLIKCKHLLN